MKFVIVSFDGLRPDLIKENLTPNICRLQRQGVALTRHRTVYPSETRVAFPSLATGATSDRHGMVGNQFVDRAAAGSRLIDTADAILLDRLDRESGGALMTAPSLGELLGRSGRSLAVLSTNTAGTTRLFHHKAEAFGHVRLSGHFREACTPEEMVSRIEAELGPLPAQPARGAPDFEGQTWITSAFLEAVWPTLRPDVSIVSYGEPDTSSHAHGTGAEATRAVIAHCDEQFGRILDWWEVEGKAADVQIIAISDHGHITGHTCADVVDDLRRSGLTAAAAPGTGIDVMVVPGQVGALYLADRSPQMLARLVEVLTEQPWCGSIFTAPRNAVDGIARGTFASSLVFADHARAPDVYFAYSADDGLDGFGLLGRTYYSGRLPPGLGVHGGLHPNELAAVGVCAGSAFRENAVSATPSGICDIVPTLLHLLGMDPPSTMNGRVLREALRADSARMPEVSIATETLETGLGEYRQQLRRVRVNDSIYLDSATATRGARDAGTMAEVA